MSEGASPQPPKKPPISRTDLSISITALVLTVLMGGAAAVLGLFSLAFLDYCPPERCSADGAANAVMTALLIAGVVGIAGLTLTMSQLARRKPGWPFAVSTLVACGIVLIFGAVAYTRAVGA
ncbi:MAG: hypothetical protein JO152_15315 [Mycobacteriaceae bacterium]|nr:hypothetical protein [Mycobacteriaceae bacterium]